ncbi:MAG: sigma-54 dependent transcriptional regulator [candidate division KSB1 bacterium]|nr:sigma-54 dependent transcriptional regulator [candidate division KSB1 bacterium]
MEEPVRVLIAEDNRNIRLQLRDIVEEAGYQVEEAADGEEALAQLSNSDFDLLLLDLQMPKLSGMQVLERAKGLAHPPEILVVTGVGTVDTAVQATRLGAFDFIEREAVERRLLVSMRNALQKRQMERENRRLRGLRQPGEMLGTSVAMAALRERIAQVAKTDSTVLILGESGAGKELVARALHQQSLRAAKPFVIVNCSALSETLLESELFGHVKGSFTGAHFAKKGKFELADSGTIFLDEIGDMSPTAQAKFLRVLEYGEIQKIGSSENMRVNVRVLAATNHQLEQDVADGRFRADLYHRLKVVILRVPPLREHPEDIPLLANHFLRAFCELSRRPQIVLSPEAMRLLLSYHWPNNVRELRNLMERVALLSSSEVVSEWELEELWERDQGGAEFFLRGRIVPLDQAWREFERAYIKRALAACNGNVSKTARLLQINRSHLHVKMKELGVGPARPGNQRLMRANEDQHH